MPKRANNELRPFEVVPHFLTHPEGSVLISAGETRVICTASVDERVPPWLMGKGTGWVTAEYDMLPRATSNRNARDAYRGRINGRSQEISRLIGRALRGVVDTKALGERTVTIDCDVIQADGGTRTTAITGSYIALALAVQHLQAQGLVRGQPLRGEVAAISVGLVDGEAYLDLDYNMDSQAQVDMNIVMTGDGELVEIQGTGEGVSFKRGQLDTLVDLALGSLPQLLDIQRRAVEAPISDPPQVIRA